MRIGDSRGGALKTLGGSDANALAQEQSVLGVKIGGMTKAVAFGTAGNVRDVKATEDSGTFTGISSTGGNMAVPFTAKFLKAVLLALPTGVNVPISLISTSLTGMIVKRADGLSGQTTTVCYIARGY